MEKLRQSGSLDVKKFVESDTAHSSNLLPFPTDVRHAQSPRLWVDIQARFRISSPDESAWSVVELTRPHAVIGRKPGCDITIGHPDIETAHTYLHFDEDGCFVIDLRTGTGMRINGRALTHGRLQTGDTLEVGGFLIRIDRLIINQNKVLRPSAPDSQPANVPMKNLVGLSLQTAGRDARNWSIRTPVAFIGYEKTCSIVLPNRGFASRIHGALIRTPQSAYFVDLVSRGTRVNGERISFDCRELFHNDRISIGQDDFVVLRSDQLEQGHRQRSHRSASREEFMTSIDLSGVCGNAGVDGQALLAGMISKIQQQHDQALERQNEMQVAMVQLLRQVQNEQTRLLDAHLDRIGHIDQEIADLKQTLSRQQTTQPKLQVNPSRPASEIKPTPAAHAQAAMVPRTQANPAAGSRPLDAETANHFESSTSASPEYTAAWLMDRVNRLEQEQTSAWKEMIGRLLGRS